MYLQTTHLQAQVEVFWLVKPYSLVDGHQCYRGTYYLHLQDSLFKKSLQVSGCVAEFKALFQV
jgi:hypothetical protein